MVTNLLLSVGLKYCSFTRLEFENQKTRLSVQLEYNREHLQKLIETVSKLRDTINKDESEITGLQKVTNIYIYTHRKYLGLKGRIAFSCT